MTYKSWKKLPSQAVAYRKASRHAWIHCLHHIQFIKMPYLVGFWSMDVSIHSYDILVYVVCGLAVGGKNKTD